MSFYPKMKFALPLVFVDGLNIGTTSVIMLKIMPEYPDEKKENLLAGICLIGFGVGSMIGGYLGGKLCDRFNIKTTTCGSLVTFFVSCCITLTGYFYPSIVLTWINCFSWGLSMYSLTACLLIICSRLYGGHP